MNPSAFLTAARAAAERQLVRYTADALHGAGSCAVMIEDVISAVMTATACTSRGGDAWLVTGGLNLDGDELAIEVTLEDGFLKVYMIKEM